jgi:hypothetical protein
MQSTWILAAVATLTALAACSSSVSNSGGGGHAGTTTSTTSTTAGTGGTTSTTSATNTGGTLPWNACRVDVDCWPPNAGAGGYFYLFCAAGDVCVDGIAPGCLGDGAFSQGCSTDADCTETDGPIPMICRNCGGVGAGYCDMPCTATHPCPPGATCDDTGHCLSKPCSAAADCPANYVCSPTENICVRKTCTTDAECSGICKSARCTEGFGSCGDCL